MSTQNLSLSQFEPSSIPDWGVDHNSNMGKIDPLIQNTIQPCTHTYDTTNSTHTLTPSSGNFVGDWVTFVTTASHTYTNELVVIDGVTLAYLISPSGAGQQAGTKTRLWNQYDRVTMYIDRSNAASPVGIVFSANSPSVVTGYGGGIVPLSSASLFRITGNMATLYYAPPTAYSFPVGETVLVIIPFGYRTLSEFFFPIQSYGTNLQYYFSGRARVDGTISFYQNSGAARSLAPCFEISWPIDH